MTGSKSNCRDITFFVWESWGLCTGGSGCKL